MSNFDTAELALKAICPRNRLVIDDKGLPSIYDTIPQMKMSDLIDGAPETLHPAFIINGQAVSKLYLGKFQASAYDGRAYSLPGEDPKVNVNHDTSKSLCTSKGAGHHMMTAIEYGLIALICKKLGHMPYGNNNYGKDTRETTRTAIPTAYESDGKTARVATGTGPTSWSHDGTNQGIWDLNGNVWEWEAGIRYVNGELQVLENNNGADQDNSTSADSTAWRCISGVTGEFLTPNGAGTTPNSVKQACVNGRVVWSTSMTDSQDTGRGCGFKDITRDSTVCDKAYWYLVALGICPVEGDTSYDDDYFWFNNGNSERAVLRGGVWNSGGNAGVFYSNSNDPRSDVKWGIGFRPAFYDENL